MGNQKGTCYRKYMCEKCEKVFRKNYAEEGRRCPYCGHGTIVRIGIGGKRHQVSEARYRKRHGEQTPIPLSAT